MLETDTKLEINEIKKNLKQTKSYILELNYEFLEHRNAIDRLETEYNHMREEKKRKKDELNEMTNVLNNLFKSRDQFQDKYDMFVQDEELDSEEGDKNWTLDTLSNNGRPVMEFPEDNTGDYDGTDFE